MKRVKMRSIPGIVTLLFLLTGNCLNGQSVRGNESITAEELKEHIYFLASDFMGGRVGTSPEYQIAAQYVGSQFAAAGLQPVVNDGNGSPSWFQPVPFRKTSYGNSYMWEVSSPEGTRLLDHNTSFRVLYGSNPVHTNCELAFVGYGINEPDYGWNDFEGLDLEGKMIICLPGAPLKDGKPVLPEEIHKKYSGMNLFTTKLGTLMNTGANGIIIIDAYRNSGIPFQMIPSQFESEKYIYAGSQGEGSRSTRSSLYMCDPSVMNTLCGGEENNPLADPDDPSAGYRTGIIKGVKLSSGLEVLAEEMVYTDNIIGMVPGTDPLLKDEYIVVGAHLDHVKPVGDQVCNGADDNASGSAAVIEIAEAVAANPLPRSVLFITYTAEEMGLRGSQYFVESGLIPEEAIRFNINMDMIGRSSPANEETRAHYVVTDKKYFDAIKGFVNGVNKGITDFPLIFDNDEDSPGGSDHQSFISHDIPAFFFFSGVHPDLHQPGDDPEKIDYPKAESIARLAYLLTVELATMKEVPDFATDK